MTILHAFIGYAYLPSCIYPGMTGSFRAFQLSFIQGRNNFRPPQWHEEKDEGVYKTVSRIYVYIPQRRTSPCFTYLNMESCNTNEIQIKFFSKRTHLEAHTFHIIEEATHIHSWFATPSALPIQHDGHLINIEKAAQRKNSEYPNLQQTMPSTLAIVHPDGAFILCGGPQWVFPSLASRAVSWLTFWAHGCAKWRLSGWTHCIFSI